MRRERKAKVGRVMTRASMKMINQSVPRAERNKAFIVQDKLATGNAAYVGTLSTSCRELRISLMLA